MAEALPVQMGGREAAHILLVVEGPTLQHGTAGGALVDLVVRGPASLAQPAGHAYSSQGH